MVSADGLERLRRWREEHRGVPPAIGRFGVELDAVTRGVTTMRLPLTPELQLPGAVPTAAVTAMLADYGLTSAVVASLPDLRGVTTIALSVEHLRPPPATGRLVATSTAEPFDDGDGEPAPQACTGELRNDGGSLVARAAGWFLATEAPMSEQERTGLPTEPAVDSLLALLQVPAERRFELHARHALSNALGTLHGGVGAMAATLAGLAALEPGRQPLSTAFTFLRPTPRDGAVRVTGTRVRTGRRTAVAQADITDTDGRLVLQAHLVCGAVTGPSSTGGRGSTTAASTLKG